VSINPPLGLLDIGVKFSAPLDLDFDEIGGYPGERAGGDIYRVRVTSICWICRQVVE